jgi:hypothetical protein
MKTLTRIIFIAITLTGLSCTEDIPECPSKMCVMAGGWKLRLIFLDDIKDEGDLTRYNLTLTMPEPATATTSTFERTQTSGNKDTGIWSVENNGTILRLIPNNDPQFTEDWIIESFSPRELILVINRDVSFKQGPGKIRFVLEPI